MTPPGPQPANGFFVCTQQQQLPAVCLYCQPSDSWNGRAGFSQETTNRTQQRASTETEGVIVAALESIQQVRIFWLYWTLGRPLELQLSNPHWCGCVMEPSLLEPWLRSGCADLLGRSAMIPTAEPVPGMCCSSAREIEVCDLPVFKVQLGPRHGTNVAMIYCLSYCAPECQEGTQTYQLCQLLCPQQCLGSAVFLCLSQICSLVVNVILGLFFFSRKPSLPPKT